MTENRTENATIEDRFAQFAQFETPSRPEVAVGGPVWEWFQDPTFWAAMITILVVLGIVIVGSWFLIDRFKSPTKVTLLRWNVGPRGCEPMRRRPDDLIYTNAQGVKTEAILQEGHGRQSKRGWFYLIDDETGFSINLNAPDYKHDEKWVDGRDVAAVREEDVHMNSLHKTNPEGWGAVLNKHVGLLVLVGGGLGLALLVAIFFTLNGAV